MMKQFFFLSFRRCPHLHRGSTSFPESPLQVLYPLLCRRPRRGGGPHKLPRHLPHRLLQHVLQNGPGVQTVAKERADALDGHGGGAAFVQCRLRVPAQPAVRVCCLGRVGHHDSPVGHDAGAARRRQAACGRVLRPGAGSQHGCLSGHQAQVVLLLVSVRLPPGTTHVQDLRTPTAARGHVEKDSLPRCAPGVLADADHYSGADSGLCGASGKERKWRRHRGSSRRQL